MSQAADVQRTRRPEPVACAPQDDYRPACVLKRRHVPAEALLRGLLHETSVRKLWLLLGNSLELSAANFVMQRELGKAGAMLEKAERLLERSATSGEFFVRKWQAIRALGLAPSDESAWRPVEGIREEARERGHWETIRDCDRFLALFTADTSLATHVWFGTPYGGFRSRLVADFGTGLVLPRSYRWRLGKEEGAAPRIDLRTGEIDGGRGTLKTGTSIHRLLLALAADFYRPFRIASLHFTLFSDRFFDPQSSLHRVHGQVRLLRAWLAEHGLPLEVRHEKGYYRLGARRPIVLEVHTGESVCTWCIA